MSDSDEIAEEAKAVADAWESFRDEEGAPIRVADLKRLELENMPEDVRVLILDDYSPETTIWRHCDLVVCEIVTVRPTAPPQSLRRIRASGPQRGSELIAQAAGASSWSRSAGRLGSRSKSARR
jgi:hypothetical protein